MFLTLIRINFKLKYNIFLIMNGIFDPPIWIYSKCINVNFYKIVEYMN